MRAFCREVQSFAAAKQIQPDAGISVGQRAQRGRRSSCYGKGARDICGRLNVGHYHDMYTIKSMLDGDDANLLPS